MPSTTHLIPELALYNLTPGRLWLRSRGLGVELGVGVKKGLETNEFEANSQKCSCQGQDQNL